jgi:hypothetical protein
MARIGFTPAMCRDKSNDMLVGIARMTVIHQHYLGSMEPDALIWLTELEKLVAELRQVN